MAGTHGFRYSTDPLKICGKRRYETKEEAEETAKHCIRLDWSPHLRAYKCPTCHNWHLTSKAK